MRGQLSTAGVSYARFVYALPFAGLYLWLVQAWGGWSLPDLSPQFLLYCLLGGLAQILFTILLVHMFALRNFAVGAAFSKTETVQVALLGYVLLGDRLEAGALLAILLSALGVMALSMAHSRLSVSALLQGLAEPSTRIGLASGFFLGVCVVCFRGATQALEHESAVMRAACTLLLTLLIQTVLMGLWLHRTEPRTLPALWVHWRWAGAVGVASLLASVAWFTAFALQNAALVRAVGQIELLFTFLASVFYFRERSTGLEIGGMVLVMAGILLIVLL